MKNTTMIILLTFVILCLQCFSQKGKETKDHFLDKSQITKSDPESKAYCSSTYSNTTDDWISNVTFGSINNSSGPELINSYGNYDTIHAGLLAGSIHTLSVSFVSNGYTQHVWAWIDWNNDDDFLDAGEAYDLGDGIDATLTTSITIPSSLLYPWRRMRIIEQYGSDPVPCDPHGTNFGETEDYYIWFFSNPYCSALGGCDEYISSVQLEGGQPWQSNCWGYFDNTYWPNPSFDIPINTPKTITVTNGNPYSTDKCGIWIDWNKDNDFDDANETLSVSDSPGEGPYTATITPPAGISLGIYTLRTRIIYSGTLDPCGTTDFGEVEDYSIDITDKVPAEWTGLASHDWHNPDNWTTITIPDATTDVIINTFYTNRCYINTGTAQCKNMTVEQSNGFELDIYDQELHVHGNMNIYGQLRMQFPAGKIITEGDIIWESGSECTSMHSDAEINVEGDWIFKTGANVTLDGLVSISGSGNSYIRTFEENCYFNNLLIDKSSAAWATIGSTNTADMHIHSDLTVEPGAILYMATPESVFIQGNLTNLGTFLGWDGTLVMNGNDQMIFGSSTGPTYFFNNLIINSLISTDILGSAITVNGYLRIESGILNSNDFTISVGEYWYNPVGPAAFNEGTGRVIFNGNSTAHIYGDENFYILELDKTTTFDLLYIEGDIVTCEQYDWTDGSISVSEGGEFTAFDLVDNGIYGGWGIDNTGGTINISNYGVDQWVDLNGDISLTGGTMNVYGGSTPSYWPYEADAKIYMTDGVLDFHDQGIYIVDNSTYSLTENITGGTIRTAWGFWGNSGDFTPGGGTMEFYGTNDADIYTDYGCYLNDVLITKGTKDNLYTKSGDDVKSVPIIDERSGKAISDGTKSNTLIQSGFLDINGSLVIESGALDTDGYNIQIEGDWINFVGDAGFIESTGWVTFDGANGADILTNEAFANLMLNKTFSGIEGLEFADGITVNVRDDLSLDNGTLEMNPFSILDVDSNLFIANEAGLNADDANNIIYIGGNWTNENNSNSSTQGFYSGGESVTFNGSTDQSLSSNAPEEVFANLIIDKPGGYFRPDANITVNDNSQILNGDLQIIQGDWWDQSSSLNHKFGGDISIETDGAYISLGTTTIMGAYDQYYTNNGDNATFEDLVVNKSGVFYLNSNMAVPVFTYIEEGTLNLNGNSFKSNGTININDGGELLVDAGASLIIIGGLYVNNGGQFTASGVNGNLANIWNDVGGKYDFEVKNGGNISANYTNFQDMNMHGIDVEDGAYINPVNAFNNCNFYNGIPLSFSALLRIENNQVLNISNINFYNVPSFIDGFNIFKSTYQGEITISPTGGDFTGPLYEYDDYNRIHWPDYVPGLWTGNVSSDWFDPMNWGDFIVPGTSTDVVIPAGTLNDPVINNSTAYCNSLEVQTGASLEIGNDELIVGITTDIYGELVMNNSLGKLTSSEIEWQSGSTDDVTAGEIHVLYWTWQDGTNAYLGTGNTAFITLSLAPYDADASFGNLEIVPVKGGEKNKGIIGEKGTYPVRVSGNCIMQAGTSWSSSGIGFIIDGNWEIENGGSFKFMNGAIATCHSDFMLNGILYLETLSQTIIHGMFNFAFSGALDIDNGTFLCDYSLPSGWINLLGSIQMTSGSVEFPDANISIAGTSNILGGTIIAGRSVASNLGGALMPIGGTLELVGSGAGHYIQITNGNHLNDLVVNRSAPIGIHPGSPLIIGGSTFIKSEFRAQGNTISAMGDFDIDGGGILNIDDNAVLTMTDTRWLAINTGGALEIIGSPGNEATITHYTGYYHFSAGNGSTISAEHAIFEYMSTEGVHLNFGAAVDPAYPFNNCTFRNGISSGRLLTIESDQDFTVYNAVFPLNTWSGAFNVYKNSTPGNVTFINAIGDFSGETFEYDPNNLVHWGSPEVRLDLKVFLEGPFNGTSMKTDINPILPLDSPFDPLLPYFGNPMPDWYYLAGGSVGFIPDPGVVDWVLVQLRDAASPGGALPATAIATTPAFLMEDGTIIAMDGSPQLTFEITPVNDLFLVIWQRNHLGVISANPLAKIGGVYPYDFSMNASQAYGGSSAQMQLSSVPEIWGMIAGDADGNGEIQLQDMANVWNFHTGNTGYLESDLNFDRQSDNQDKNDYWVPNLGMGSSIPE